MSGKLPFLSCWSVLLLSAAFALGQAPRPITPVKVADVNTVYATFQSHNQKVVENAYGVFMTYLYSDAKWRLARSLDGGKSFGTLTWAGGVTKPPVLETDEHGSIYVIASYNDEHPGGRAVFYRFDPEKNFLNPHVALIPQGFAENFASFYDRGRRRLYYATSWNSPIPNFYAFDRDGNVLFSRAMTRPGSMSQVDFPYLTMDELNGRLFLAWTTRTTTDPPAYRAILYIYSDDGGETWKRPGPTGGRNTLSLPMIGDENGGARVVNLPDEYEANTWLSSFVAKGGGAFTPDTVLHFAYFAQTPLNRQHYVRFNPATEGTRNLDFQPVWRGRSLTLKGLEGFFATDEGVDTPLFMVGYTTPRQIGTLASTTVGMMWTDHAKGADLPDGYTLYALSGNRRPTQAGDILGHYTKRDVNPDDGTFYSVWFFRAEGVDRSLSAERDWLMLPLDIRLAQPDSGFNFILGDIPIDHGGDSLNHDYSKLRLFENRREIGKGGHSLHADIRSQGAGRFSHWNRDLYFSSSDGSDPRTNGRRYQVAIPTLQGQRIFFYGQLDPASMSHQGGNSYKVTQDFATEGDSIELPMHSRLVLYEDSRPLGPGHSTLADIRRGGGPYSHRGGDLYFSASDNTDPRTNGRIYTYRIDAPDIPKCGTLFVEDSFPSVGFSYFLFGFNGPTFPPTPFLFFENGIPLSPDTVANVQTLGAGRFGFGIGGLYFSSSDNSDPRFNGRIYTWTSIKGCPVDL